MVNAIIWDFDEIFLIVLFQWDNKSASIVAVTTKKYYLRFYLII